MRTYLDVEEFRIRPKYKAVQQLNYDNGTYIK